MKCGTSLNVSGVGLNGTMGATCSTLTSLKPVGNTLQTEAACTKATNTVNTRLNMCTTTTCTQMLMRNRDKHVVQQLLIMVNSLLVINGPFANDDDVSVLAETTI